MARPTSSPKAMKGPKGTKFYLNDDKNPNLPALAKAGYKVVYKSFQPSNVKEAETRATEIAAEINKNGGHAIPAKTGAATWVVFLRGNKGKDISTRKLLEQFYGY